MRTEFLKGNLNETRHLEDKSKWDYIKMSPEIVGWLWFDVLFLIQ